MIVRPRIAIVCALGASASMAVAPRPAATAPGTPDSAWVTCGVPLARGIGTRLDWRVFDDGAGGMIAVWQQLPPTSAFTDIFAQRVQADGRLAPGWPSTGRAVCTAPKSQFDLVACPDGAGGLFAAWDDSRQEGHGGTEPRVYVQHVLGDGSVAPGWNADGNRASALEALQLHPAIAPDGAGGAYVVWGVGVGRLTLQRFRPEGGPAAGWPALGRPLIGSIGGQPDACIDGAGGVYVVWSDGGWIRTTRVRADGSLAPGWSEDGTVICTGTECFTPNAVPDGAGGLFVSLIKGYQVGDVWLQRVLGEGTRPPGWPIEGISLSMAPGNQYVPSLALDGAAGVFAAWQDWRTNTARVFAAHIGAGGARIAGWPEDGLEVTSNIILSRDGALIADGAGGVMLGATDADRGAVVFRIASDGTTQAGWPIDGIALCDEGIENEPSLVPDGAGGALVAVGDVRDTVTQRNVYATHLYADGSLPHGIANFRALATPGRVQLAWHDGEAADPVAYVERWELRTGIREEIATVTLGVNGWSYVDTDVADGGTYAYRLRVTTAGSPREVGLVYVVVPSTLKLAFGVEINPSNADFAVTLSFPDEADTRIEVFDVAGRRVADHRLGSMGPGRAIVPLDRGQHLRNGVYFVRMRHGRAERHTHAALIR